MSEMTFYIEEIEDGDPGPSPPPDGGESDEDSGGEGDNFINLGDLTAQLTDLNQPSNDEVTSSENADGSSNGGGTNSSKGKKKKNNREKKDKNKSTPGVPAANTASGIYFGKGDRVELYGLVGKVELNGSLGVISSEGMLSSGRYSIMLDDGNGPFDLKPSNIKKTVQPPSSQWLLSAAKFSPKTTSTGNDTSKSTTSNITSRAPSGRGGASATLINGDGTLTPNICIFGGADRTGTHNNDVYMLSNVRREEVGESQEVTWDWQKFLSSDTRVTGKVPQPRSGHSAIACQRNKHEMKGNKSLVVVFGGSDLSSGKMYDDLFYLIISHGAEGKNATEECTTTLEWRSIQARGQPPAARNAHTACMVTLKSPTTTLSNENKTVSCDDGDNDKDGNTSEVMVLFGGTTSDGPTNDIYILDQPGSVSPTWSKVSVNQTPSPKPREMHSSCVISSSSVQNNAAFKQKKSTPSSFSSESSPTSGYMLVVGGRVGEVETASDVWMLTITCSSSQETADSNSTEKDSSLKERVFSCQWTALPDMPSPRCGHVSYLLSSNSYRENPADRGGDGDGAEEAKVRSLDEHLVVYGGIDGSAFTTQSLIFNTGTGKWIEKTFPCDKERLGHAAVVYTTNTELSAAKTSPARLLVEEENSSTEVLSYDSMLVFGGVNPTEDLTHVVSITPPLSR